MRPSNLVIGSTLYWTIRIFDADGALIDADSVPTVAVRKNGAATADSVTVTKRAATTGIYDCSYNPAGEAAGDIWTIEESVLVGAAPSSNSWECTAILDLTSANVWDYDIEAYYVAGSAGELVFDLSEEVTGTGTLITQIDTQTSQLTFTEPGQVDANAKTSVGDATEAKQDTILSKLVNPVVIFSGVDTKGNLTIIRGDDYDNTSWPVLSWDAGKDITGATVTLTIRHETTDAVLLTATGSGAGTVASVPVASAKTSQLSIGTCKFDVEIDQSGSKQTIAGTGDGQVCCVKEDQTR